MTTATTTTPDIPDAPVNRAIQLHTDEPGRLVVDHDGRVLAE
jgi:hypothetical protein